MNLEGKIIGNRYQIIEKIGTGGMATVYKAKCNLLNRYVAIKILRDEFTTDEEFVKRFNIEAQAAASLSHPNIVSIYDVGHVENLHYIVMELVQGKTLKEIIDEDGSISWKWSLNIAIQIASALEVAHRHGIVHRDIKPHNIIITEDGVAKVTDFGIAKAVSNSTITAFGTTIGSVHYFSPEHARGGFTDAKSDIYSLGIVMYEMLTGRVPFDADTPVSIALMHMQEKPTEPIKLNPKIPIAVDKIIMKAIEKEITLRYQTASEMLADLKRAVKEPDVNFVKSENLDKSYTQKIPVIDESLRKNAKKNLTKKEKFIKYLQEHKAAKVWLIIFAALVLFLSAMGITSGVLKLTKGEDVQIPDLSGMTQEEAIKTLKKLKFDYEIVEESSIDVEKGKVISQEPKYRDNYKIKEGSEKFKITISKGTEVVKVPKITGKTFEEAKTELETLGIKVEKIEEISQKIEAGYVTKQDPEENKEINAGETVKVYVSKGTGISTATVPSVIGKTLEVAKVTLEGQGFVVEVKKQDDDGQEGLVLKQSVAEGQVVDEGTTITLTVSQKAQVKSANVYVNLKSLIKNYSSKVGEVDSYVELKVTSGGETLYIDEYSDVTSTNINAGTLKGTSAKTVTIYIDDVYITEAKVDFSQGSYTIER